MLLSLDRWTYLIDLLPPGADTYSGTYRSLHREARSVARDGLIQMVRLPTGRKRAIVGPIGRRFDLEP